MFKITKDIISDGDDVGITSHDYDGRELKHTFHLYDDDGELYYYGKSDNQNFDPLDWAMGWAGCTEIRYFINGKLETL